MQQELRMQRIKEKNRRAQKKFREKVKERDAALCHRVRKLENEVRRISQEKDALEGQFKDLRALLSGSESSVEQPYVASKGFGKNLHPLKSQSGVLLTVACHRRLSHHEAMSLSLADHSSIHKAIWMKARQLLDENPAWDFDCLSGQELQALMHEKHGLAAYLAGNNPLLMHRLQYLRKVEADQSVAPDLWSRALQAMKLTSDQKNYLLENRHRLIHTLEQLMDERVLLQQKLKAVDATYPDSRHLIAEMHISWAQITQAIRDNVDKEHVALCRFYAWLWRRPHGINAFQEAQLICSTYPHFPDIFKILDELKGEVIVERPILLDADEEEDTLLPAKTLPDPSVDRYQPISAKILSAIFNSKNTLVDTGNR